MHVALLTATHRNCALNMVKDSVSSHTLTLTHKLIKSENTWLVWPSHMFCTLIFVHGQSQLEIFLWSTVKPLYLFDALGQIDQGQRKLIGIRLMQCNNKTKVGQDFDYGLSRHQMSPHKWSGWTIYGKFCCHKWSSWTIYGCHGWSSRTIYGAIGGPPLPRIVSPTKRLSLEMLRTRMHFSRRIAMVQ